MKKSFLFLLISIMTVFLIAGCADDTTKGEETTQVTEGSESLDITVTGPTEINLSQPETLVGAYEIIFFYTNGANFLSISSDCTKVQEYTGVADSKCVQGHNSVDFKGYGSLSTTSNSYDLVTKMQMTNQCLKDPNYGDCANDKAFGVINAWSMAQDNQYNYTIFTSIPSSQVTTSGINTGESPVKGVTGRNLTKTTSPSAANSTYKFELTAEGYLKNTMVDTSSGTSANVTVIMKKISDTPISDMKINTPLPTPAITGFVANPQ